MKERLTGAIILVALLVLLVPELLSGPGPAAPASTVASESDAPLRSYTIVLSEDANARQPVVAPSAATVAVSAPSEPQSAGGGESPQPVPDEGGAAGEVRPSAEVAQAPADAPKQAIPLAAEQPEPRERRAPAEQPASAAEASKPASSAEAASASRSTRTEPPVTQGWMVQIGSFASRDNATRLAGQLKDKGFAAIVNETTGKGRHLYRVRVGPEADRAAAEALRAKLRAAGHRGAIVPPP